MIFFYFFFYFQLFQDFISLSNYVIKCYFQNIFHMLISKTYFLDTRKITVLFEFFKPLLFSHFNFFKKVFITVSAFVFKYFLIWFWRKNILNWFILMILICRCQKQNPIFFFDTFPSKKLFWKTLCIIISNIF